MSACTARQQQRLQLQGGSNRRAPPALLLDTQDMLSDANPMVVANALAALQEIQEISGKVGGRDGLSGEWRASAWSRPCRLLWLSLTRYLDGRPALSASLVHCSRCSSSPSRP